jgi:hypothetical protein
MTDQPEKKSETEDVDADFEGHSMDVKGVKGDISDVKGATDDDGADFEGHSFDVKGMKGVKGVKA